MSTVSAELPRRSFGETMRARCSVDAAVAGVSWPWRIYCLFDLGGVSGSPLFFGNYISPFYSPEIVGDSPHSWFGPKPSWWPAWLLFSPALLILWAPGGFRSPAIIIGAPTTRHSGPTRLACAVGEPRKTYLGERSFPLIMQNVHRYFLYLALIFIVILSIDVWKALWFTDSAGRTSLGVGLGTIVLAINVVLLGGYTFGCHSLRHLIGGFRDQLSRAPACYQAYRCVSCFNRRHMLWAWMSLFWVGFSDLYVRLCSMGIWHDFRIV